MTEWLHFHFSLSCIGEGNGNPLQWSCLENPRDRGALWTAVYGIAQSRTRLKWLSSSSSQYSCLENPVDRGAWWAAVHRVTQSLTRLKWLSMHACIEEGNGNPVQYSCLENPRDRGTWWAAVYVVAQSGAWLKRRSSSSERGHLPVISPIFTNISKD